jgi:hypothetical protein
LDLALAEDRLEAVHVEVEALEHERGEEQVPLALERPGVETLRLRGVFLAEHDEVGLDVGVLADDVGVRVVALCFVIHHW